MDGIVAPHLDVEENKKRIARMEDRISSIVDLMDEEVRASKHKSSRKAVDSVALGPAYSRILRMKNCAKVARGECKSAK